MSAILSSLSPDAGVPVCQLFPWTGVFLTVQAIASLVTSIALGVLLAFLSSAITEMRSLMAALRDHHGRTGTSTRTERDP